jgi:hypothetical protein
MHVQFCCMPIRESGHLEKASRVGRYHEQPNAGPNLSSLDEQLVRLVHGKLVARLRNQH